MRFYWGWVAHISPTLFFALLGVLFGHIAAAIFGGRRHGESYGVADWRQKTIIKAVIIGFTLVGLVINIILIWPIIDTKGWVGFLRSWLGFWFW